MINFSEKTQPSAVGVKFDPLSRHIPMACGLTSGYDILPFGITGLFWLMHEMEAFLNATSIAGYSEILYY